MTGASYATRKDVPRHSRIQACSRPATEKCSIRSERRESIIVHRIRFSPRAQVLAIVVVVALIAGVSGVFAPLVVVPIVLALVLSSAVALGLQLRMLRRSQKTDIEMVRDEMRSNHKRASVWDWRINERLTREGVNWVQVEGQATASGDYVVNRTRNVSTSWKGHPQASALLETGAFSLGFYRAASGKKFARATDSASHYLSIGMRELISPNAFVSVDHFPAEIRTAMKSGDAEKMISFLLSERDAFGPAFDPSCVERRADSATGPLGQFMRDLNSNTGLPVPATSPLSGRNALTYGDEVTNVARQLRGERALRAPRATSNWDADAESRWKAEVKAVTGFGSPTVSVVMPVWNRLGLVGAAISSVLSQTYEDWELLVVDDHSTDGTWEFLQSFKSTDSRIRVLRNPRKGVSSARNAGVASAIGEFVAFLDSDNEWRPDYLECMVKACMRDDLRW